MIKLLNCWLCKIFGHDIRSTDFKEWEDTRMNFVCKTCGKKFASVKELKT